VSCFLEPCPERVLWWCPPVPLVPLIPRFVCFASFLFGHIKRDWSDEVVGQFVPAPATRHVHDGLFGEWVSLRVFDRTGPVAVGHLGSEL